MKNIFMSPILYAVVGMVINEIIIYVKNYKVVKNSEGKKNIEFKFEIDILNFKMPPTAENIINIILAICTIVTFIMSENKIRDAIAIILVYVIEAIIFSILENIIINKFISKKNNKQ